MASIPVMHPLPSPSSPRFLSPRLPLPRKLSLPKKPFSSTVVKAKSSGKDLKKAPVEVEVEEEEVEEELPWLQEKALDLVEFTGTVTNAVPGPRVGRSKLPWILAVPIAYIGISFVIAIVKTVKKVTSPRAKKKRLVNKNAYLLKEIDELFHKGKDEVSNLSVKELMQKTGFSMDEVLRKYIRYALNEKPFNPELVVNLIHLRKSTLLLDSQVAEVLNEISRRIVKEKGPVVMDISGFTEKGFKRKLAVQALFAKILYLAELPEFCSRDSSLTVKEIFGVTDEDADALRINTLSEAGDFESLENMVDDPDMEEPADDTSD